MATKSLFGLWSEFKASDINRILRPYSVRIVVKASKEWGGQVAVTAHPILADAKRATSGVAPSPGVKVAA